MNKLNIDDFNKNNQDFSLFIENNILYLKSKKHTDWLPFSINFLSNNLIKRKEYFGINQEISKAMGIKKDYKPRILDATAGLGRDSFLLASIGVDVIMIERNPVIFAMLENALINARLEKEISSITEKMILINANSIDYLKDNNDFDVIYIDPMFPKSNKSRLVKKEMQIFREIVGDDLDSEELLDLALKKKAKRVVVKRMIKSEYIKNLKPNFEIKGKIIRFDVYVGSSVCFRK
jgi:16S rRNA (guanine1516-N2)-methyltransferase